MAWTEALTRIAETHAPDATYAEARRHFEDKELVDLTTLIGLINLSGAGGSVFASDSCFRE